MYHRMTAAAAAAMLLPASLASATGPDVLLEDGVFNYNADNYMGDAFGYGTRLTHAFRNGDNIDQHTTGLFGNIVPLNFIGDGSQFNNGQPVMLTNQTASNQSDLFTNPNLQDMFGAVEFAGQGDGQGFTSFTATHKALAGVTDTMPSTFDIASAEVFSQAIFQVDSDTGGAEIGLDIVIDAALDFLVNGSVSSGLLIQLINISDPEDQALIAELSGFFFQEDGDTISSFLDLAGNEVGAFSSVENGDGFSSVFDVSFLMDLDVGETYALNISMDVAAGLSGEGSAFIDSSNSLDVTLRTIDPAARLVVPAPGSLVLLGLGGLAVRRRR
ncbi:MAG: hypothetical protein AAF297_05925 [Planctomycetota bacterium]